VKYFYGEVTFDRDGLDFAMCVPGSDPVVHRNYRIL
jgi:hypothetical protein